METFIDYCKNYVLEHIDGYEGQEVYLCDLGFTLTEGPNCDGTLTYEAGKVSEENAEAIRFFQKEGGKFTLATGRFPGHAYEFGDQITINAPMVALNGTVLYDLKNEKIIHEWTATREDYLELFEYIHQNYPEVSYQYHYK